MYAAFFHAFFIYKNCFSFRASKTVLLSARSDDQVIAQDFEVLAN